eukprot:5837340-Alexandrium_andersonii.AAC.1
MAWLQSHSPAEELKRLQRNAPQPTLEQVFEASRQRGACVYDSLEDIPDAELVERVCPRPAGYAAQTRVHLRDLMVPALLDSGATVSAIPEEVLCGVL